MPLHRRPCGLLAATLLAGAAVVVPAHAQDSTRLADRALVATCAACHGTEGRPVSDSTVPGLAGLPAPYFQLQMKAFKDGSRPVTVMHQIAKGYSDEQIDRMAAYFAALPR